MNSLRVFLKELFAVWGRSRTPRLAAALAYYSLFSLAPMLFIALTVAGLFTRDLNITGLLFSSLEDILGPDTVILLESILDDLSKRNITSVTLTSMIGLVALFIAATGLFAQLKDSLNTIWEAAPARVNGAIKVVKDRLLAFLLVLGAGILIVVSSFAILVVGLLASFLHFNGPISLVNNLVVLALLMLSLTVLYKVLPDAKIAWRDVWLGAAITGILLFLGSRLMGYYIGYSNLASAFGAAGALAVLLVGVYYLTQIFLFGAVFTRVYAHRYGSLRQVPADWTAPQ